ncbi:hypothetical protein H7H48_17020 [Nitratireductor sp. B36]|uniref:VpaChn25_0724 family phage protein n=1 Tax=Nitratireductor sp. B36 TaxID=2762059 RepID=UPI001E345E84|nr:hypothetical protein [Nitratireductor sp. B36]MCC5780767.1 hypothetical protein [Nitratireductor sp. B36]MEC9243448.1 hypothetical protein [Pseudomonadota bacterium]
MNYAAFAKADARLIILKELSRQTDGRMNETMLTSVLDTFGHRRSRDWVRTQLRALEELGAVTLVEAGTVLIASISRAGLDHVERRIVIEGIAKPSPEH